MRQLKFRVWDKDSKDMLYPGAGIYGFLTYDGIPVFVKATGIPHVIDSYEVMQFTGLLDKNGKEIYEDDILYVRDQWNEPVVDKEEGRVFFQEGCF